MVAQACRPSWFENADSKCPYGIHADIPFSGLTVPNDVTVLSIVAIALSIAPLILSACLCGSLMMKRRVSDFLGLNLFVFHGVVNFSLKWIFEEGRPIGSCLTSCGMPSGHSQMALGFALWFCIIENPALGVPFIFVPWSRVYLRDHSILQVFIGSLVGFAVTLVFLAAVRLILKPDGQARRFISRHLVSDCRQFEVSLRLLSNVQDADHDESSARSRAESILSAENECKTALVRKINSNASNETMSTDTNDANRPRGSSVASDDLDENKEVQAHNQV